MSLCPENWGGSAEYGAGTKSAPGFEQGTDAFQVDTVGQGLTDEGLGSEDDFNLGHDGSEDSSLVYLEKGHFRDLVTRKIVTRNSSA